MSVTLPYPVADYTPLPAVGRCGCDFCALARQTAVTAVRRLGDAMRALGLAFKEAAESGASLCDAFGRRCGTSIGTSRCPRCRTGCRDSRH